MSRIQMGDTQLDVITARKCLLCGFSGFSGLLAKLVYGDAVRYHDVEATDEDQDEGDDADEPHKIQTVEQNWTQK